MPNPVHLAIIINYTSCVVVVRKVEMKSKLFLFVGLVATLCPLPMSHGHKPVHPMELIERENAKVKLEGGVTLKVSPDHLIKSGEWVTVSWHGVNQPADADWVGVYSPPLNDIYQINPVQFAPVKLQFANYSSSHMSRGYGSLGFKLMNMREEYVFGFFRGGLSNLTLVAISNTVGFENYNEPLQGHLALTEDPTEMVLMWVTESRKMPVVYWGEKSAYYYKVKIQTLTAKSVSYNSSDMCGSPATDFGWRKPGLLHKVVLDGLTPGKKYYYMYGDFYGWSGEKSFVAAPAIGADVTTTVIAFGDMGCGEVDDSLFLAEDIQPNSLTTTDILQKQVNNISFVLHIGDISYARGFSAVWDIFFDQIEPIASQVPYMVCIGNHERNWPSTYPGYYNNSESGGECGIPHYHRFPMPRAGFDKPWFGYDNGQVHYVMMSTEHDFTPGSEQHTYLNEHLARVDRNVTPWLVFAGHRPMYVASSDNVEPDGHQPVAQSLRDSLEDLLYKYKVDIALWAHHHSYQRTCPVYKEECTEDAPIHLVIGMGGRELSTDLIPEENPSWIEAVDFYHYGYTKLTANSKTLTWEFIRNEDNLVSDSFVLKKNYNPKPDNGGGGSGDHPPGPRPPHHRNQVAEKLSPNEL